VIRTPPHHAVTPPHRTDHKDPAQHHDQLTLRGIGHGPQTAVIQTLSMRHEDLLARTDWSVVEHAYSGTLEVPQTPKILTALLSDDVASQATG
jgi:hypothetical protein